MKIIRPNQVVFCCLCAASSMSCNLNSVSSTQSFPDRSAAAFYSSFESSDPSLTWVNSPEIDRQGHIKVSGIRPYNIEVLPGTVMDQVVSVNASGENPPQETSAASVDGDVSTKWLVENTTGWVQLKLQRSTVVKRYSVTSANDVPERDPANFALEGSLDGTAWTVLDEQRDQQFTARFQTLTYSFANDRAFPYYRVNVTRNNGGPLLQIADWQISNGDDQVPAKSAMKSIVGKGPNNSANAKSAMGFTGLQALRFGGNLVRQGPGYSYNKIFDVDIAVSATTELSYLIFPEGELSTFAAIDLAFDDGTYLSDLNAVDQHYTSLDPQAQGRSRALYANEWNHKVSQIGAVAAGRKIKRIIIGYDNPQEAEGPFGGWVDDIRISARSSNPTPAHLSDYVLTTRGTNSSGGFSRGNNFPATAVPHGFNFWTPVTYAGSDSWLYSYHNGNNSDNLPTLEALALSHEPSPWMGDRQTFQVMPSLASGKPSLDRGARALAFQHKNEIGRAHYYSVTFENGIKAEIAPTDHAALFRFTYPGTDANLIFDNVKTNGGLTLDPATQSISGYSDAGSGLSTGASRIFIYAVFDKAIEASEKQSGVSGYYRFKISPDDKVVNMRIASSLISLEQAKKNLDMEIEAADSLDSVRDAAQQAWDEKLGVVQVEGANFDQRTTLYSNLYRLFLYPNSGFENTGTAEAPVYQYASPVSHSNDTNSDIKTGARIVSGKIYVNNGFWDTYRATWPALSLLTPKKAGELIDGFVSQYKEGGWIARWSSPGYADLMTGTSSDVAFADAFVKGVQNFDSAAAYDAALKNATVLPSNGGVGRKGMETSQFLGYTSTATGAGLSWAMAANLNDFGIANFAKEMAKNAGPRQQEYKEEAEYFLSRSQQYVNLFDPAIDFFQGRSKEGAFRLAPEDYDPRVWGFDYTETNGWNTAFDAPHDAEGLARLYGGREALAEKLDQFFSTPETAEFPGSYGGVIHEMLEAREVRMGQLGMSNQPSFHIPYMYNFAGQPWKTQEKVRDALARLWIGSSIGQGYLGDDDNGAMSAWQILSALGFYPLQVGSPNYVIGSPLFTKATVNLENGQKLVINAPQNSSKNIYVQGLSINGQPYSKNWLTHSMLVDGATLDFDMGPQPSSWGSRAEDLPPSITKPGESPNPMHDAALSSNGDINERALVDDNSTTQVTFSGANPAVNFHFKNGTAAVEFYTLTSGTNGNDPSAWVLKGSQNGTTWTTLDQRSQQTFPWRTQTRPFKVSKPGSYSYYRLEMNANPGMALAEWELLTRSKQSFKNQNW